MLMKQKSLIVAFISSFIISLVLVLTLIGYLVYIELRAEEFKRSYAELLQKTNAKVYSKYIDISGLSASIGNAGALKGKPLIEGNIRNTGYRNVTNLLIKVKFLDRDGAVIYETAFHPHEPSLGASALVPVSIPYLSSPAMVILKPNDSFSFKKILTNCPQEISAALHEKMGFAKGAGRWAGKLSYEVLSVEFS